MLISKALVIDANLLQIVGLTFKRISSTLFFLNFKWGVLVRSMASNDADQSFAAVAESSNKSFFFPSFPWKWVGGGTACRELYSTAAFWTLQCRLRVVYIWRLFRCTVQYSNCQCNKSTRSKLGGKCVVECTMQCSGCLYLCAYSNWDYRYFANLNSRSSVNEYRLLFLLSLGWSGVFCFYI
jgi:hypothetical protein